MNSRLILERVYRLPAGKLSLTGRVRSLWRKASRKVQRYTTAILFSSVGVSLWVVSHVYYYNLLLDLEMNVRTARAQIEVAEQRRNHIQRNLTQLTRYYARYEHKVLKDVTGLRTAKKPEKVAPTEALARLDAVAEQYPSLQLNGTVRQFSDSIVDSETLIATRAAEYNEAVNVYTTALGEFPGNIFGRVMGFEPVEYYSPDKSVLGYHEVKP